MVSVGEYWQGREDGGGDNPGNLASASQDQVMHAWLPVRQNNNFFPSRRASLVCVENVKTVVAGPVRRCRRTAESGQLLCKEPPKKNLKFLKSLPRILIFYVPRYREKHLLLSTDGRNSQFQVAAHFLEKKRKMTCRAMNNQPLQSSYHNTSRGHRPRSARLRKACVGACCDHDKPHPNKMCLAPSSPICCYESESAASAASGDQTCNQCVAAHGPTSFSVPCPPSLAREPFSCSTCDFMFHRPKVAGGYFCTACRGGYQGAPGNYYRSLATGVTCNAQPHTPPPWTHLCNCVRCKEGTSSAGGPTISTAVTAVCTACSRGTYSASPASSSCSNCPAGQYSASPASSSCSNCPAGQHSASPASSSCSNCPAGQYSASPASSSCTPCPGGTYEKNGYDNTPGATWQGQYSASPASTSCTPCPADTYTKTPGATSCPPWSASPACKQWTGSNNTCGGTVCDTANGYCDCGIALDSSFESCMKPMFNVPSSCTQQDDCTPKWKGTICVRTVTAQGNSAGAQGWGCMYPQPP